MQPNNSALRRPEAAHRTRGALAAGTALGLVCALLSVMAAGGGHGWNSAWPFGFLSTMLYPLTLVLYAKRGPASDLALLVALAVVLDIIIIVMTVREGVHYLYAVLPIAMTWLAFWLFWQMALLVALIRRYRMKSDPS